MKISFSQSGGFAGLRKGCEVDSDQLPPEESAILNGLLDQGPHVVPKKNPEARDVAQYELTVERGGQTFRFAMDHLSVPDTVRPLIQFLRKQATPR